MGGCYPSGDENQQICQQKVDSCVDFDLKESLIIEPETSKSMALFRVLKHKDNILKINPVDLDQALRAALTWMMTGDLVENIPPESGKGLRYLKNRINVPRDMPLWSARRFREALEKVASIEGNFLS